jgi:hypothetical protein
VWRQTRQISDRFSSTSPERCSLSLIRTVNTRHVSRTVGLITERSTGCSTHSRASVRTHSRVQWTEASSSQLIMPTAAPRLVPEKRKSRSCQEPWLSIRSKLTDQQPTFPWLMERRPIFHSTLPDLRDSRESGQIPTTDLWRSSDPSFSWTSRTSE